MEGASLASQEELLHLASFEEVLGAFTHEINQPLNAIMIAAQVIQLRLDKTLLPQAEKAFLTKRLELVSTQVEKAASLVRQLKGFGKPRTGVAGESGLKQVFEEVLGLMNQQFVSRGIELGYEIDSQADTSVPMDRHIVEPVMVQALAYCRDVVQAVDAWHTEQSRAYHKYVKVRLYQEAGAPVMVLEWAPGDLPADCVLVAPETRLGLSAAEAVMSSRKGGLRVAPASVTLSFP
jgi:C4-dicarboxylate-specific signal transduction histidine kinase